MLEDVLTRVEDDLARGDHESARRRLREALVDHPHRLDLRLALAQVYRCLGDLPQAGRWGYLSEQTPAEEVLAFRRACGDDAATMLEALAWGAEDGADPAAEREVTAFARQQLAQLRRAAGVPVSPRARASRTDPRSPVPYPFTPAQGLPDPSAGSSGPPVRRKARLRELVGLGLIFLGLATVLLFVLSLGGVAVYLVSRFLDAAYL